MRAAHGGVHAPLSATRAAHGGVHASRSGTRAAHGGVHASRSGDRMVGPSHPRTTQSPGVHVVSLTSVGADLRRHTTTPMLLSPSEPERSEATAVPSPRRSLSLHNGSPIPPSGS